MKLNLVVMVSADSQTFGRKKKLIYNLLNSISKFLPTINCDNFVGKIFLKLTLLTKHLSYNNSKQNWQHYQWNACVRLMLTDNC